MSDSLAENVRRVDQGTAPIRFARGWHCLGLASDFSPVFLFLNGEPYHLHGVNRH